MKPFKILFFVILSILILSSISFAGRYKYTKSYVTKTGQYRRGALKDVSGNGNKFDNANTLGLNGKR